MLCWVHNFPLRTAFTVSHKFWVVVVSFSFVSRYLLISSLTLVLTHSLLSNMLFSLQVFGLKCSRYQLSPSDQVCHLTTVSLLIFCLEDLSIEVNYMLKSPTMTVLLSVSPFLSIKIYLTCLDAPMLGA